LFTMVGIAGEDDLDAPDLSNPPPSDRGAGTQDIGQLSAAEAAAHSNDASKMQTTIAVISQPPMTCADLVADIESCKTSADLNLRAANLLKAKNRLSSGEAKHVEAAFTARLIALDSPSDAPVVEATAASEATQADQRPVTNG